MNYAEIKNYDIANGLGVRTSLFVSGCWHHCENCFNQETWDFNFGKPFTEETIDLILKYLEPYYIKGLTLIGGDPLCGNNWEALLPLVEIVKKSYPTKDIWCYTGYTLEELLENPKHENRIKLLNYVDVLVDGRFIEDQKNLQLRFRGSSNQRLIDMNKTLKSYPEIIPYKL